MIVAISTLRRPKIEAVKNVVEILGSALLNYVRPVEWLARRTESGVSSTPTTDRELMQGAYNRVSNLIESALGEKEGIDYYVGLEGGLNRKVFRDHEVVFLQSWVYVSNGTQGYFGSSGNICLPKKISDRVLGGEELGGVIDSVSQLQDVKSKQGTFGVLTKDRLTRRQSFEIALLSAFAPFYNPEMYR